MHNSTSLRSKLRHQRRALTPQQQRQHSLAAARYAATSRYFINSQRIAFYLAADGELDPLPLLKRARSHGKHIYLPVLRPGLHNTLWFAEFRTGDRLIKNRFGILEPDTRRRKPTPPWGLDLILLPLVGFDPQGNRLGMGGGYYDRTLAYLHRHLYWQRPRLMGLAHQCQQVATLDRQPWDIPLQHIVTENGLSNFHS